VISIDVIVAVHNTQRPIRRAVASVLAASTSSRALVVAHGVDPDRISAHLVGIDQERVRVIGFVDGVASPAGPFNAGMAAATAPYLTVLGSDDELEPGSLDVALQRLRRSSGAQICILPVKHATGERVETPLVRPGHIGDLDVVRDRVFTRTAPLCVMPREVALAVHPMFDPRFRSGEDINAGVRLWTSWRCIYHRADPGYLIHDDVTDRVTTQAALDLQQALAAPSALGAEPWVAALDPRVKQSLAAKMIRVHLLGILTVKSTLRDHEIAIARRFIGTWTALAPGALRSLPIVERRIVDALQRGGAEDVTVAISRRESTGAMSRLLTRNPLRSLDRDGVLRRYLTYRAYRRLDGV